MSAIAANVKQPGYNQNTAMQVRRRLEQAYPAAGDYVDEFLTHTSALNSEDREPWRFAVIKVSGDIVANPDELRQFAGAVARLGMMGLPTTIVHGGGTQIGSALKADGITSAHNEDGTRITEPAHMVPVKRALQIVNTELKQAIYLRGGQPVSFSGVFRAHLASEDDRGSVTHLTHVEVDKIKKATKNNNIAVVSCLGETVLSNGVHADANVNADIAWQGMVAALQPWKAIALGKVPGILDENGAVVSKLTVAEAAALQQSGVISGGMVVKTAKATDILARNPEVDDVVITNVENLEPELYTPEGAGTYIVRD